MVKSRNRRGSDEYESEDEMTEEEFEKELTQSALFDTFIVRWNFQVYLKSYFLFREVTAAYQSTS